MIWLAHTTFSFVFIQFNPMMGGMPGGPPREQANNYLSYLSIQFNPMMGGMPGGPPREQANNLDPEIWQQFENNTGK